MEQKIVVFDSQRLDSIQTCSYLYNIKFQRNLVPVETALYLERGGLIHDMLQVYYNLRRYRSRWSLNGKSHSDIVQSCITAGRHLANKMSLDISEVEETVHVFMQYTDHWENDGWDSIVGVEEVGSKILYEDESLVILYEVKIDLILKLSNTIVPVDHKHSSSRRDPNFLANQFKGYCWFLSVNNLIQNEIGFQKTIKPVDKFRRHTISFSDAILQEWIDNTVFWIKLQLGFDEAGISPRNYTSCNKFSGCELRYICMSDPGEFREFKIKQSLKERLWDVGKEQLEKSHT